MSSVLLLTVCLAGFAFFYRGYGRYLEMLFGIDPRRVTPARRFEDGKDFVPAKNSWILFGHHFAAISGAGPIVGPVLACAYWGWGFPVLWIFFGAILMGAVHDFVALTMSVRAGGESIALTSQTEISKNAKFFFSLFLWMALILVIAVFSIFAAKTLMTEPDTVLPSFGVIPVSVLTGWLLYRMRVSQARATAAGLILILALLYGGSKLPFSMPDSGLISAENLWVLILLAYCFVASVAPVQLILLPRGYLTSFVLYGLVLVGLAGVFWVRPEIHAPVFTGFRPSEWPEAGPLWPMLFVTIACGAISGFHSLVASGTTSKQISSERDALKIGYGGLIAEAVVAVLVVIAVAGGLGYPELVNQVKTGGPVAAFARGYESIASFALGGYARVFAVLALNAFIFTTLDTATRITRYLTAELFGIKNIYAASALVVFAGGALAVSGQWALLWPAFGTANQLIAGLSLLVGACWLVDRGKSSRAVLIPALVMLVTTLAAAAYQFMLAVTYHDRFGGWRPNGILTAVSLAFMAVTIQMMTESYRIFKNPKRQASGV